MKRNENYLSIDLWYRDIQIKGYSLERIPENKRTPEMCFVAIHYWGAALKWVPEKYKTYELCLDAVRHNTPVDEGCSALAFVPEELKTYELCLEAIRHDYLTSILWESGTSVEWDYAAAIIFVPEKLRTPELCFEAFIHDPHSPPGCFDFIENETEYTECDEPISLATVEVTPESIQNILDSSELFIKALKQIGMPDEYDKDALEYFEKIKIEIKDGAAWATASPHVDSGDMGHADSSAAKVQFYLPKGVAVDRAGNVYLADSGNHRIRKISASGDVSTLTGSGSPGYADGSGTEAHFYDPSDVAVDAVGNVYVADSFNNRIRKISPSRDVSTLAGSGSSGSDYTIGGYADGGGAEAQFYEPTGVAVDAVGNVYVADCWNDRIRKISPLGDVSTLAGSGAEAQFHCPEGIAVDAAGTVYVADYRNNRIRKISPSGDVSTLAGSGYEGFVDGNGTEAEFKGPAGVAVDSSGNVYVADYGNHCIRKISPSGEVSTLAGWGYKGYADGSDAEPQFHEPNGVAVDAAGNVYVADSGNHRIRKISPAGDVSTLAGGSGAEV